jgi:hypothetical protein
MPANAGIQVRFQFKFRNRLDSAGMTGTRRRLGVDPETRNLIQKCLDTGLLRYDGQERETSSKELECIVSHQFDR